MLSISPGDMTYIGNHFTNTGSLLSLECISSFGKDISAHQMFVSDCDFVELYLNVTQDQCVLKACLDMQTMVNFCSNVCSVRKCVGQDFNLQGEDAGWDIYMSSGLKIKLYVLS